MAAVSLSAPFSTALSIALFDSSSIISAFVLDSVLWTESTTPLTRAVAAPMAFATAEHLGLTTLIAPARTSGAMTAPPPTSMTEISSGKVFIMSTMLSGLDLGLEFGQGLVQM